MRWFDLAAEESERLLQGHHDPVLTLLSILVAVLAGCMAMQVAGLARVSTRRQTRQFALLSGSVALGGGVWAMHFIGMLALDIGIPVQFAMLPTVLSLLPALGASWVALWLLARWRLNSWHLVLGGILVGGGIGAMHYTGMAAMRMPARLSFDPLGFALSIVLAILLAVLALWIRFGLQRHGRRARERVLVGGTVMGLAIASMHYSGMAAARFVGAPDVVPSPLGPGANSELAFGVALLVLVIVGLVMAANGVARYRDLYWRMQDNEARLRAVFDTAVDGIITIDRRGGIRSFNQSAEALFGWRESEVRGRNIKMLMPQPERTHHDAYLANYLETGKASIIGIGREVTALRKNGESVPIRLAIGETRVGGEPLFVGFVSDISAQRQAASELVAAKERAEAAAAAKSAFLANMSHEIRTPMNAIIGLSDVLLDSRLEPAQRKHLRTLQSAARNLLGVLNAVLDTARLEGGTVELERDVFCLRELCEHVLEMFRVEASRKQIELTLEYGAVATHWHGDALRVRQILNNLLGNAVKFTERGSVRVLVTAAQPGVTIDIIDTGIGIAPARLERIFEPFVQADASMNRRFGGTGLGTTIARELATLMDGEIRVDSEEGVGSRFRVMLPLRPASASDLVRGAREVPAAPDGAEGIVAHHALDESAARACAGKLVSALRRGRYDAVHVEALRGTLACDEHAALCEAIDDFDFERAIRHIEALFPPSADFQRPAPAKDIT